jgi:hypothetical protein
MYRVVPSIEDDLSSRAPKSSLRDRHTGHVLLIRHDRPSRTRRKPRPPRPQPRPPRTNERGLPLLDCTFAEFDAALAAAKVIEERQLGPAELKELGLVVDWVRPPHVFIVDDEHQEERVVTVYQPDPDQWSSDYRGRR